jgi:RNA polymerase sigma factor (sigma-70 family)
MGTSPAPEPARSLPGEIRSLLAAREDPAQANAWAEFLRAYTKLILFVARRTPGGYDTVMDRYTFVLGKLQEHDFRRLRSYAEDGRAKFSTWLTVVIQRLCVDFNRLKTGRVATAAPESRAPPRRLVELVFIAPELLDRLPDPTAGTDDELHRRQVLERLEAAIASLSSSDQLLLALLYDDGLSAREIAAVMSVATPFHIYRRLERVHQALRRLLTAGAANPLPAVQYRAEP